MKVTIPDQLKADVPQTIWGKILAATPVVMTVIATMLAGLASSEMTRAQYDRSLAAQQQSKAGDQWGYFQAKRLRAALQRNTLDLLQATAEIRPLDLTKLGAKIGGAVAAALQKGELPVAPPPAEFGSAIRAALEAIEAQKAEPEIARLLSAVTDQELARAVTSARDRANQLDAATTPVNRQIDELERELAAGDAQLRRDFTAARLRYTSARYDAEARLNQTIANLFELQVRKNNISAERHHRRSGRFFFGMLGAQAAVIIATFAMAARKRNLLWALAAAAGAGAISFAVYVYLYV